MGKHFKLEITDDGFSYERATEKIVAEAALDGIYVIRTSVPAERLKAEDTVSLQGPLGSGEGVSEPENSGFES